MICSAPVRMLTTARDRPGWATVLPLTRGIRASDRLGPRLDRLGVGADGPQQAGRGRSLGDQQRAEQVRGFDRGVSRPRSQR